MGLLTQACATIPNHAQWFKVLKIEAVDGDTVIANLDLRMGVVLLAQRIRLRGINAPELGGPRAAAAIAAQRALAAMLKQGTVHYRRSQESRERYGRWVGDIYVAKRDGTILFCNQALVDGKFATSHRV